MGIWIARDKSGELNVYCRKPEQRKSGYFSCSSLIGNVPRRLYPEVTFENSPKELIIETVQ